MFVKNIGNDYIASVKNDQFLCAPEDVEQMPVEGLLLQGGRERSYGATKYDATTTS